MPRKRNPAVVTFDSKEQLYVDVRKSGIVGYGMTADEASQMADAVERTRIPLVKTRSAPKPRRYRFNYQTFRFELDQ
jgi:ribulose-5-phosphate 4-epimerase/fuculose-1-phosphate aldolase